MKLTILSYRGAICGTDYWRGLRCDGPLSQRTNGKRRALTYRGQ
jgi:hypothetical protein